jgi:hypothetical protein
MICAHPRWEILPSAGAPVDDNVVVDPDVLVD